MIETEHPSLPVVRQCELVSISRSSFYYQPVGETAENLELMRLIDAQSWRRHGMALARWPGTSAVTVTRSAASEFGG